MLDSLRNFASSWLGKLLTVLLLIGLAGFGISNILTTIGSDVVARVGSQDITTREFQRAYTAQLNAAAQQLGTTPTSTQALSLGLPTAALNRAASDAALNELAGRLGLGASDAKLAELLRNDPSFQDRLGKFDPNSFNLVLQQNGFTEAEYLKTLRKSAGRQQIVLATLADFPAPKTVEKLINGYFEDKRVLDYFAITPASILPPAEPTQEEMAAYLKDHQTKYRTQPSRTATLVVLTPEALAANISVSDAEIAARYEQTKASLSVVETRTIKQVVLADQQKRDAFEAGLKQAKSFDALASELGLKVVDLGTLSKAQISDADLADAAFGMQQGDTRVIPGVTGARAVTVTAINPEHTQSLSEARDQIAQQLKLKKAREEYVTILDQIEEQRAALKPIAEIAKQFNLAATTTTLTREGKALADVKAIPAADQTRVATAVFNQEQGTLAPAIQLSSNLTVWFDLEKVTPARDQTLAEVQDQIKTAILNERTDAQMKDEAEKAVKAITDGANLDNVAIARNATPEQSQPVNRQGDKKDISPAVTSMAFDGPTGHVGYAKNSAGNYVVFKVASVEPAASGPQAQLKQTVDNAIRDDVYSGFVNALRTDAGLSVNREVLNQVIGTNLN